MNNRSIQRPQRATIKDVALAAGVSVMTVSNVLNGRIQNVGETTRKRVEREIARLNYRRRSSARGLRAAHQRSIGMVIVDESPLFLADQFTCQVVAGLANILAQHDFTLTLQGVRGDQLEGSIIIRDVEVDGFCAMLSGPPESRKRVRDRLATLNQPVIIFQEAVEPEFPDFCAVRQDDRGGGQLLADHLLARRVSNFLVVLPRQQWPALENRIAGMRERLEADPSVSITIIESNSESFADVQAALSAHLSENPPPQALVGGNDAIAAAGMTYLLDNGYRVPENIRVVGFNGFEAHNYARPPLTTVRSSAYELGESAGAAMLERLKTGTFSKAEHLLPVVLAPNQTT